MRKVYVVMERGEELPDSVWATKEAADAKAKQFGGEESGDVMVQEYALQGEE